YEALKVREYAGMLLRGYFIKGISGIQFMLPEAYAKLSSQGEPQILNACDPAQVYGKVVSRSDELLSFSNIPGTAMILDEGKPIVILERFGDKISFTASQEQLVKGLKAFQQAFMAKRIWPDKKKIQVKNWPEAPEQKQLLEEALKEAGFKNDLMKMVLYRQAV
ncbi:MAG: DEAD/DEAH box helicase, partial [Clostridia bacterium]|nr:DEAD/DEAH box helicase [Clostridia bacterium]